MKFTLGKWVVYVWFRSRPFWTFHRAPHGVFIDAGWLAVDFYRSEV